MGSSTSKPRKKGNHSHLAKVGTPANEAYEAEAVPMRPVSDADMLRFLIENRGVTQVEVAKQAGIAESTISEVLAGKRKLNRSQIGKLACFFHVEPGVFVFGE